jgi:hypothetical protein
VDEVAVDVEEPCAVGLHVDEVRVPDLVVEGARRVGGIFAGHGSAPELEEV